MPISVLGTGKTKSEFNTAKNEFVIIAVTFSRLEVNTKDGPLTYEIPRKQNNDVKSSC